MTRSSSPIIKDESKWRCRRLRVHRDGWRVQRCWGPNPQPRARQASAVQCWGQCCRLQRHSLIRVTCSSDTRQSSATVAHFLSYASLMVSLASDRKRDAVKCEKKITEVTLTRCLANENNKRSQECDCSSFLLLFTPLYSFFPRLSVGIKIQNLKRK